GNEIVDADVSPQDQSRMTATFTQRGTEFIRRSVQEGKPFFLYMPHPMVHVPLYAGDAFQGKSGKGVFADVVMELDWSVGQILQTLKSTNQDSNTLVVFTSDNGPWLSYGDHAGSSGGLREGKGTMFEGGYREPTLFRWPGKIPAGKTSNVFASTIDIFPTVAALIGATLPQHEIDGKDIRSILHGDENAVSPHKSFPCYYAGGQLQAVRDGRWKLHFPHGYRTLNGRPGGTGGQPVRYENKKIGMALYDLENDRNETTNVIDDNSDVVARLKAAAEAYRKTLGDRLTNRKGPDIRPAGRVQ
ncbi:MAG: sulfatase-like hydrolase/transferase, partial [Planctomycetota bacterium]